jgi:hypothetical protein
MLLFMMHVQLLLVVGSIKLCMCFSVFLPRCKSKKKNGRCRLRGEAVCLYDSSDSFPVIDALARLPRIRPSREACIKTQGPRSQIARLVFVALVGKENAAHMQPRRLLLTLAAV